MRHKILRISEVLDEEGEYSTVDNCAKNDTFVSYIKSSRKRCRNLRMHSPSPQGSKVLYFHFS
jgi:hypothetical protein